MRSLKILVAIVALTGCISEKQRAKICSECPRKDSVSYARKDTIIYRDTVMFLTLQGDSIKVPVPCPDSKPFDIKKKKNGIVTEIKSDGKTITADCEADSLKLVIAKLRADHYTSIDSFRSDVVKLPCENERTAWDGFCKWNAYIFWVLLLFVILYFLGKRFLKGIPFP